jgi:hypothetical protein
MKFRVILKIPKIFEILKLKSYPYNIKGRIIVFNLEKVAFKSTEIKSCGSGFDWNRGTGQYLLRIPITRLLTMITYKLLVLRGYRTVTQDTNNANNSVLYIYLHFILKIQ